MKKIVILFALFAISCNPFENISEVKKREEALKNPRFQELPEEDMYAFLNEVYLPRLDSLGFSKNIYVHVLDFEPKEIDTSKFLSSSSPNRKVTPRVKIETDPQIDTTSSWNIKKIQSAQIIYDRHKFFETKQSLMFISKPFKDTQSDVVIMREYYSEYMCCLCHGEKLAFLRTTTGWKQVPWTDEFLLKRQSF